MKYFSLNQNVPYYEGALDYFTNDNTNYTFIETHTVGISILPEYYEILCDLANEDINAFLKYLYFKFHKKLLSIKVAPLKRTATATYQPPSHQYKNKKLKNISPYIWDKYWDLRKTTGYSISYIIRLFIEWELEFKEKVEQNDIDKIKEECRRTGVNLCEYPTFTFENNYEWEKKGSSAKSDIIINFKDRFY